MSRPVAPGFLLLLAMGLACLPSSGCSSAGATREDIAQARAIAAAAEEQVAAADGRIAQLEAGILAARQLAEQTGSEQAYATAAALQGMLAQGREQLPAIQAAATRARVAAEQLEAQGDSVVPWWKVGIALLVPVLLPLARGIPVIGPAVGTFGEIAWKFYSTKQQKDAQARIEAEAAALPFQVMVGHKALTALEPERAQALKDAARREQEMAGVSEAIRPHVLAIEAKAG
jgi:hypothetical protein